jgi:deoxyribodipyrimidine photo-lyase
MSQDTLSIVWLRRDLRLHDHAALAKALNSNGSVQPVFIFDTDILGAFPNPHDRRLSFIARTLCALHGQLAKRGGGLLVLHGSAKQLVPALHKALGAQDVFTAEDYEPAAIARDKHVAQLVPLTCVKDQVIFAPYEVLKDDGTAFKVFTPFSRAWLSKFTPSDMAAYELNDTGRYADYATTLATCHASGLKVLNVAQGEQVMLSDIGYTYREDELWPVEGVRKRLADFIRERTAGYPIARDMVAESGTSHMSPYFRFGLVSLREAVALAHAQGGAEKWISELIWREFYAMILYHYPESVDKEWNPNYRGINWSYDEEKLEQWKQGRTGYPIVDAAMRELLETGWMHNRARMIVASFLTKDLQIDWRLGEAHFAQHLMDYEQASNVGGWQWAASTGTDAQPWFRIFNPTLQSKKFDPKGDYIRRYVPELRHFKDDAIHEPWKLGLLSGYTPPIVDHAQAREKTLKMFKDITRPLGE